MIPVELPAILKEVLKLCRSSIPSTIEIASEIQQDCPQIMADPTQMHQIIMNLMVNAQHAIEQTGGTISVHLKEIQLEELDLKGTPLQPGKYAKLSISDTGCGMDPAILEKIFEPYFTTKAQGKGTGLGLAVVYGIIQEHGGHISVYSESGKGSTFNIFLPLVDHPTIKTFSKHENLYRSIGDEHILVVDDEKLIIELESRMLTRLGYHVTTCRNGSEALTVFKEKPEDFDLVITDLNMPNMTGDQLARRIISIRPDTPIIICTGFSEIMSHDDSKAIGVKEFVMKPVTTSEMSEKVRKVLDNAHPDISQDLENG
jgi:CheY-like chemotaxis protein